MLEELKTALNSISDKYSDFVNGICNLLEYDEEYQEKVIEYIKSNPDVKSGDVILFLKPYCENLEVEEDEDYEEDEDAS